MKIVITNALELAAQGFPLSHKQIKEHIDKILYAHLGNAFSIGGVGENWAHCFVEKNLDWLKIY